MAKKTYVGVNNIAREVKSGYVGVNNIARKVKKGYVGVGGVARPCWAEGEPKPELTSILYHPAGFSNGWLYSTEVGNYAIYSGLTLAGYVPQFMSGNFYGYNLIEAFDTTFTNVSIANLDTARSAIAMASVGNYALLAGGAAGQRLAARTYKNIVETYSDVLTHGYADNISLISGSANATKLVFMSGATINNYAIFSGNGDFYSKELVRGSFGSFGFESIAGENSCATNVGNYAIFLKCGGNKIFAFDTSLVRTDIDFSLAGSIRASRAPNNKAIFTSAYTGDNEWLHLMFSSIDNALMVTNLYNMNSEAMPITSNSSLSPSALGDYFLVTYMMTKPIGINYNFIYVSDFISSSFVRYGSDSRDMTFHGMSVYNYCMDAEFNNYVAYGIFFNSTILANGAPGTRESLIFELV